METEHVVFRVAMTMTVQTVKSAQMMTVAEFLVKPPVTVQMDKGV